MCFWEIFFHWIVYWLVLLHKEINNFYKQKLMYNPEWFCDFSWGLFLFSGYSLHSKIFALLISLPSDRLFWLNRLTLICARLKFKDLSQLWQVEPLLLSPSHLKAWALQELKAGQPDKHTDFTLTQPHFTNVKWSHSQSRHTLLSARL